MLEKYIAGAFFLVFVFLVLSRASESNAIITSIARAVNENLALLQGRQTFFSESVVEPSRRTLQGGLLG